MPIRQESNKTKKMLFSILIGFVLISSIIGFTFSAVPFGLQNQDSTIKYNGIEFFQTQNGIATIIDGQVMEFTYLPDELESMEIDGVTKKISSARMIYTTSDPNSTLASQISGAEFNMAMVLEKNYKTFVDVAFTSDNPYGKSVITCDDATYLIPVFFFNFTNTTTSVTDQNDCIIVNVASEKALDRVRDKIIYELLGVLP
ncbi:hypothetical protein J4470_03425 [Candidatus Woesearchaeota archaeon]|nr:hypothetical protein [Candidatus Woesearchaeota archaeon]